MPVSEILVGPFQKWRIDALRNLPFMSYFFQRVGTTIETLTEAQRRLMQRYKEGLALALGVPVSAIKPGLAEKWILSFTRGVTRPEYWAQEIVVEW